MKWCVTCKKYVETCVHYELMKGEGWQKEMDTSKEYREMIEREVKATLEAIQNGGIPL